MKINFLILQICELAYAKFQGKKELIAHFERGTVMHFEAEDKKPLILPTPNPLPKIELPIVNFIVFQLKKPLFERFFFNKLRNK